MKSLTNDQANQSCRDVQRHIGRKIHKARLKQSKPLKYVSRKTGLAIQTLDNIELGRGRLSLFATIKIAAYYEVSLGTLFEDL